MVDKETVDRLNSNIDTSTDVDGCVSMELGTAMALLNHVTPRNVVNEVKSNRIINAWNGYCPGCGEFVFSGQLNEDETPVIYCKHCGQALKFNRP